MCCAKLTPSSPGEVGLCPLRRRLGERRDSPAGPGVADPRPTGHRHVGRRTGARLRVSSAIREPTRGTRRTPRAIRDQSEARVVRGLAKELDPARTLLLAERPSEAPRHHPVVTTEASRCTNAGHRRPRPATPPRAPDGRVPSPRRAARAASRGDELPVEIGVIRSSAGAPRAHSRRRPVVRLRVRLSPRARSSLAFMFCLCVGDVHPWSRTTISLPGAGDLRRERLDLRPAGVSLTARGSSLALRAVACQIRVRSRRPTTDCRRLDAVARLACPRGTPALLARTAN